MDDGSFSPGSSVAGALEWDGASLEAGLSLPPGALLLLGRGLAELSGPELAEGAWLPLGWGVSSGPGSPLSSAPGSSEGSAEAVGSGLVTTVAGLGFV